jgi:hypothetical protein
MFAYHGRRSGRIRFAVLTILILAVSFPATLLSADYDHSLYMAPSEVKPGMKGFGRTVMSGTDIQTFNVEVISVMRNAFYAKQDVILVRCSGLNLEHSGIIGGMSGSPCYIRDEQGRERMIGAVAYGWSFSKDPICGVQPITQMLEVAEVRKPKPDSRPAESSKPATGSAEARISGGIPLENWIAKAVGEPIPADSRLAALNRPDAVPLTAKASPTADVEGLRPLDTPVMVSSLSKESMAFLDKWFRRYSLVPVAAGGPSGQAGIDAEKVRLEPGSALCVAMMTGDITMEGLGTCTVVIGDKVLGFGHQMFGEGAIELPLATGFVHTVIPSVARSNKMGGALKIVGTLWGDEATAISGIVGRTPAMIPLEVVINDIRGKQVYHYNVVLEPQISAVLLTSGMMESVYAHNSPPRDHTIRHSIEVDFGDLGIYKASNVTSDRGISEPAIDLQYPVETLLNPPLAQKATVRSARVEITIEDTSQSATIYAASLPKTVYKPGETVTANVRWSHYRKDPLFTDASYGLKLPDDIADGDYELLLCSAAGQLSAMRSEKPYLFRAETLAEALTAFNLLGSFPGDRLYMRLNLKRGGVAYKQVEMPDLPASRRRILADAKLTADLSSYSEALVAVHKTDFVVGGRYSAPIQVRRHPEP